MADVVQRIKVWYFKVARWKYSCLKPKNLEQLIADQKKKNRDAKKQKGDIIELSKRPLMIAQSQPELVESEQSNGDIEVLNSDRINRFGRSTTVRTAINRPKA